jgi:hypothetical protein
MIDVSVIYHFLATKIASDDEPPMTSKRSITMGKTLKRLHSSSLVTSEASSG